MIRRYLLPHFIRRTGIWLGLFALVLQSLAGTSHAGAMAAAVTGNLQPLSGAFGLLQICTPLGIVEIDPRQGVPAERRSIEQTCSLCSATALCGFVFAQPVHASVPANIEIFLNAIPRQILAMRLILGRKGLSRAPPV